MGKILAFDSDCSDLGADHLDAHNGHDHDSVGYHYHVTVESDDDGRWIDVFPLRIGPSFAGVLPDGATVVCGGGETGPPPGP